jgi:hypothetical protein
LLVLPGPDDLRSRARGHVYWQEWATRLGARGVRIFDLSETLLRLEAEHRSIFAPEGHYTPEANAGVARALAGMLAG